MQLEREESAQRAKKLSERDTLIQIYAANPVMFVEKELGVKLSKDQAEFMESMSDLDSLHFIISAGRGSGKTMVLAMVVAWSVACLPRVYGEYNVCVVGGSLEQAKALYNYFKKYIFMTPLLYDKLMSEPTMTKTDFKDSWVRCLAASEKQVRSPHPELLIFDEVCQAEENIVESALPMTSSSRHGRDILSSTPNQMFHIFKRYWDQAVKYGFRKFGPWGLQNCPWVTPDKLTHAKTTYSESRYATEILGQFAKEDGSIFSPADLDVAFKSEFKNLANIEIIAGIDWGQDHPTVLTLGQKGHGTYTIFHQEIWHGQRYVETQRKIVEICKAHRCDTIYADSSHSGENERLGDAGLEVEEIYFSALKDEMVENITFLMETGKLKISKEMEQLKTELGQYQRVRKRSGRSTYTKVNDDCVDSAMLCLWGLKQSSQDIGESERVGPKYADLPISF
jgi:hypothetical protein